MRRIQLPREGQAGEDFAAGDTHCLGFCGLWWPTASLEQAGGNNGLASPGAALEPWGICWISKRQMGRALG